MNSPKKAVLLAAGFGTRLRPLTDHRAKPVLPFFNQTIAEYLLDILADAGIESVFINLHYQGWSVRRYLRSYRQHNMSVRFSFEPVILGTAGVLHPLYPHLKNSSFIMINGDILTDIDLRKMINLHNNHPDSIATVALHPPSNTGHFEPVGADKDNYLSSFPYGHLLNGRSAWQGTFAGIHIMRPEIFHFIRKHSYQCINSQAYADALEHGYRISAYRHEGYWSDIGTPARYLAAHRDVFNRRLCINNVMNWSHSFWCHPTADVHPDTFIGTNVVIGAGCRIDENVHLQNVVIWPGCTVHRRQRLHDGIMFSSERFLPIPQETYK
ncbi:NDP-sugar synthase [bacterium]|nr:NDP-sugar synthase [candidate division CSSED10-310 bacterium]